MGWLRDELDRQVEEGRKKAAEELYRWENEHGTYELHVRSGIIFRQEPGGHWESTSDRGINQEILRLRDAMVAERERYVREIKDMMRTLDSIGQRGPHGPNYCCMQTLDELLRRAKKG